MFRIALLLATVIGLLTGCGFSHTDPVTLAGGRVESDMSASVQKASEAAKATLVEYKQTIVQYSVTSTHGRIVAYTLTSQRIEIDVVQAFDHSRISIRTEGQGGEEISTTLMQRIRKLL